MEFVPFEDVAKVELVYSMENQIMENVLYYSFSYGWSVPNMTGFASTMQSLWDAQMKARVTAQLSLTKIIITDMTTESSPKVEHAVSPAIAGTAAGDALPANCAAEITLVTGLRGRSYRGRIYVPGVPDTSATGSSWNAGFITSLSGAFGNFISVIYGAGSAHLVVASRVHNKIVRTTGVASEVLSVTVSPYICSQRRRLPGRGQ